MPRFVYKAFYSPPKGATSDIAALILAMTFVILPLLPERTINPFKVFNPYQTWLIVVLVKLGIVLALGGQKIGGWLALYYLLTIGVMTGVLFILQ